MTKKDTSLVLILVILAGIYVFCFTNWFKTKPIRIFSTSRHIQYARVRNDLPYILFGLEGDYRLTEIKVVPLPEFQKNPEAAAPVWHLISDSNSIPIKEFTYGQHIHGMKAAVGGEPQDLDTNIMYHLIVTAGHVKGEHNFQIK